MCLVGGVTGVWLEVVDSPCVYPRAYLLAAQVDVSLKVCSCPRK